MRGISGEEKVKGNHQIKRSRHTKEEQTISYQGKEILKVEDKKVREKFSLVSLGEKACLGPSGDWE